MTNSKPESNDNQQSQRRFRAVPPRTSSRNVAKQEAIKPLSPPQPPTTSSSPSEAEPPKRSYTAWWIAGTIFIVCGVISQIPVQPHVRADAWLQPDPQVRRKIYAPAAGQVTEVLVDPDESVSEDQPLMVIANKDLDEEIKGWNFRRLENQVEMDTAQQGMLTAQARLNSLQANISLVQQRVDQLQTELNGMKNGALPPEIAGYEAQIASLKGQSASMEGTLARYQELLEKEAVPEAQVDSIEREMLAIEAQIGEFQSAKGTVERRLWDELNRKQEQLAQLQNSYQVAMQEYQAAQNLVNSRLPVQEALDQEIKERVERREEEKTIFAPISGTVTSQDLYALEGRILQKGELLFEIANPEQLVAVIEVKQEDRDLLKKGAIVTFNPPEPSLPSFTTKIEKIVRVIEADQTLNQSMVRFVAKIENEEGQFQLGAKMYARIESPEKITRGEQAWRQIVNLFKIRKYS